MMTDRPTYPNFPGKHAHDAFFSPQEFVDYRRRTGRLPSFPFPEAVIFCYQRSLHEHVLATHNLTNAGGFAGEFHLLAGTGGRVGLSGNFGIGAPVVTILLEEFVAFGVRRFVSIGTAGALARELRIGDIVVCDRAIRDEGVSHHYLPPAKYALASPTLTDRLEHALRDQGVTTVRGTSWTIDTPYRETVAEARHYQEEGVLAVEMEAAALFAVAQYRGVDLASAITISDSLADLVWDPQFHAAPTQAGLERLFRAAVAALLDEVPNDPIRRLP
jgi:uridine phosphorylase